MRKIYFRHELVDLIQGAGITFAFARHFRGLTQDEVAKKLGIEGENKKEKIRNNMP